MPDCGFERVTTALCDITRKVFFRIVLAEASLKLTKPSKCKGLGLSYFMVDRLETLNVICI